MSEVPSLAFLRFSRIRSKHFTLCALSASAKRRPRGLSGGMGDDGWLADSGELGEKWLRGDRRPPAPPAGERGDGDKRPCEGRAKEGENDTAGNEKRFMFSMSSLPPLYRSAGWTFIMPWRPLDPPAGTPRTVRVLDMLYERLWLETRNGQSNVKQSGAQLGSRGEGGEGDWRSSGRGEARQDSVRSPELCIPDIDKGGPSNPSGMSS